MTTQLPRVLSGIQPSGDSMQLGNYLGAVRNWVAMQDAYDAYYCVVDLHSITVEFPEPEQLRQRTRIVTAQLLAAGIDPESSALFVQSHVPAHPQLCWVLECLTGFGEASRMTQFKDKSQKMGADRQGVGLLTYPILQAADILLYQANLVPIGADQRQHLELTRNLAQRFNSRFGDTFVVPDALIPADSAKVLDLSDPSAKMSKSRGEAGTVYLSDDAATIAKKFKRAVTDTETDIRFDPESKPGVSNLLTIYAIFADTTVDKVEAEFSGRGYGTLKQAVADVVIDFAVPFAARAAELLQDPAELDQILRRGAERAQLVAQPTVATAYQRVGFLSPQPDQSSGS